MFELTEEQKMIKTNAQWFWLKEIDPIIDERERRAATGEVFSREETLWIIDKLAQMGYLDTADEEGGEGLSRVSHGLLREVQGYFWVSTYTLGLGGDRSRILDRMTPECRQQYAGRLKGMLGAAGISESNAGGSPMPRFAEFKAVLDGDFWVCNGTKAWTSGGGVSDYITCTTLIDRGKGVEETGTIFIDRYESPYQTREMPKLGWRCCSLTETTFTDCRVPKENMLLGAGDAGTALGFTTGRIGIAAMGTGLGQACVDASTKYMQETQRWGKPLASFQLVQNMLVNMAVETDCARYLYLRACDAADGLEKGGQLVAESTRDPRVGELRLYSSMAKYFCCDAANRTAYNAVSIHGAAGVLEDLRIERYYRDARTLNIPDGTSEIQRLIIGRELTGINAIR